jgi:hypothetical protein
MKSQILFLLITVTVLTSACAIMGRNTGASGKAKKEREYIPGRTSDYHSINKTDDVLTIAPIIPILGSMQGGATIGNLAAFTGVNFTNTHMRLGTLKAEWIYYFDYHLTDDENQDIYVPAFPYGRLSPTSYKLTYDFPLIKLKSEIKQEDLFLGSSKDNTHYLAVEADVQYIWNMYFRAGLTKRYMYTVTYDYSTNNYYTTGIDQKMNTLKAGLVFSKTANTSLRVELDDPKYKPMYKPARKMRTEYYIDFDYYLSGKVLPVDAYTLVNSGSVWNPDYTVVKEMRNPENDMKFYRTGFEIGIHALEFRYRFLTIHFAVAVGSGVGHIHKDATPLFLKTRYQIGFGVFRKGKKQIGY